MQTLVIAALVAAMSFVVAPAQAGGWQLAPIPDSAIHAELLESESALSVRLSVWPDLGFANFGPGALDILGPEGWLAQKWAKPPYDFLLAVVPDESYFVRARIWRKGGEVGRQGALWTSSTTVLRIEAVEEEPEFPSPTVTPSAIPLPPPPEPGVPFDEVKRIVEESYNAGFSDAKKAYEEASAEKPVDRGGGIQIHWEGPEDLPPPPESPQATVTETDCVAVVVNIRDRDGRPAFAAVRLYHSGGETNIQGTGRLSASVPAGPISVQVRRDGTRWTLGQGQQPAVEARDDQTITWDLTRVPEGDVR